jgi:hypothetical protein
VYRATLLDSYKLLIRLKDPFPADATVGEKCNWAALAAQGRLIWDHRRRQPVDRPYAVRQDL